MTMYEDNIQGARECLRADCGHVEDASGCRLVREPWPRVWRAVGASGNDNRPDLVFYLGAADKRPQFEHRLPLR